jgi:hypothetical protein
MVMRGDHQSPRDFDRWLNANAVIGSLLAIGMLAMALAAITTSPKSSNVAGSTSHELSKAAQGRESAGVNPRLSGRDTELVPVRNRQPRH